MTSTIDVTKKLIFLNVGEPTRKKREEHELGIRKHSLRRWDNCLKFGFISAGQGTKWVDQIKKVEIGDIICAYVSECGFVGIGKCVSKAVLIKNFITPKKELLIKENLYQPTFILKLNVDSKLIGEHAIGVDWFENLVVSKENAKSVKALNLGITQHIYTDLAGNKMKIDFLENAFNVKFQFPFNQTNNCEK